MRRFDWNVEKNQKLKSERNISFEEVVYAIVNGFLLDVYMHPIQERYPGQQIYVVNIRNYVYLVPFVVDGEIRFLKTIVPSRKATRKYLLGGE